MCEFTVYVDGHEDENIVAEAVIKAVVKPECVVLMNTSGKSVKVPNARKNVLKGYPVESRLFTEDY